MPISQDLPEGYCKSCGCQPQTKRVAIPVGLGRHTATCSCGNQYPSQTSYDSVWNSIPPTIEYPEQQKANAKKAAIGLLVIGALLAGVMMADRGK